MPSLSRLELRELHAQLQAHALAISGSGDALENAFRRFDSDHDGMLTLDELCAHARERARARVRTCDAVSTTMPIDCGHLMN